jgi:uncharacterized protein (DUF302 family)
VLAIDYDAALAKVPEALKAEGFGVLSEIDVRETLRAMLGVDFRRRITASAWSRRRMTRR